MARDNPYRFLGSKKEMPFKGHLLQLCFFAVNVRSSFHRFDQLTGINPAYCRIAVSGPVMAAADVSVEPK